MEVGLKGVLQDSCSNNTHDSFLSNTNNALNKNVSGSMEICSDVLKKKKKRGDRRAVHEDMTVCGPFKELQTLALAWTGRYSLNSAGSSSSE